MFMHQHFAVENSCWIYCWYLSNHSA